MHGGKRPGAGRKRGGLTRKTTEIAQAAVERGITPLEVMLLAMTHYHEAGDRARAVEVARHAAPYVHPRLSAIAIGGGESPVKVALVEELTVTHVNGNDHQDGPPSQGAAGLPPE